MYCGEEFLRPNRIARALVKNSLKRVAKFLKIYDPV